MDVKEIKNTGFFKKKIDIGEFFYNEDGSARLAAEVYVIMREPTTAEFNKIASDNKDQNVKAIIDLFPKVVIGHNLENNGEQISNEEVGKLILQSASCFAFLIEEWQKSLPLIARNAKKLKEQQDQSSEAT